MARDRRNDTFLQHYVRGLGLSTRNNALAYGYSITVTAGYGALQSQRHNPTVPEVFGFIVGAALPFGVLNAALTRGFRRRVEREPPVVMALGTALSLFSISVSVAVITLVAWQLGGWLPWLLGPLTGTISYLALADLEIAVARVAHHVAGTENLEER